MMGSEKNGGRMVGLLMLVLIGAAACADYPSGISKPSTAGDTYATKEDTPITVAAAQGILANDAAGEGTALTLLTTGKVATEKGGTVVLESDGSFSYAPPPDFNGVDSLVYQIKNAAGKLSQGVMSVTVTALNDAPGFAAANPPRVAEDAGPQTIESWAAFDPGCANESGQTATYIIDQVSNPGLFAASPAVAADGTLTYAPAADRSGSSTFEVQVQDSAGTADGGVDTSEAQAFTITVTSVNDGPTIGDIGDQGAIEDTVGASIAFTVRDPDTAWGALTLSAVSDNEILVSAAHILFGGSGANRTVTLVPIANQNGTAGITITVSDGSTTASDSFKCTVASVNDAPSFAASNPPSVNEDAPAQSIPAWAKSFVAGPSDEAAQTVLGYTVSQVSNRALFAVQPAVARNGTLSYTPAPNVNGACTFTVFVQDSGGTASGGVDRSVPKTFPLTINPVNDAPVAVADTASTPVLTPVNISPLDNDTDVDTANGQLSIVSAVVAGGSGEIAYTSRVVLYVPNVTDLVPRNDIITYVVSDNDSNDPKTASGTITVTITPVFSPQAQGADSSAVAPTDFYATSVNRMLEVTAADGVLANDRDPMGAELAVTFPGTRESLYGGQVQLAMDGGFSYAPAANFIGQDSFVYRAVPEGDPDMAYNGKAVVSVVDGDARVSLADASCDPLLAEGELSGLAAVDDHYPAREDEPLMVGREQGVLANDRDPMGAPVSLTVSGPLTSHFGGEVDLRPDGGFAYEPAGNFAGNDYFSYTIQHGTALDAATVTIRVAAQNDPPQAQEDHYVARINTPAGVSADSGVLANDREADDDPLGIATPGRFATDRGGKVQMLESGAFIYTPAYEFSGLDRFDYTVGDGRGLFDAATVTITVMP